MGSRSNTETPLRLLAALLEQRMWSQADLARRVGVQPQTVIERLAEYGTTLTITIDLEAKRPAGFEQKTVRVVKENATTLKFRTAEFETE